MSIDIERTQALQAIEQQLQQVQVHKQTLRGKILELESAVNAVKDSKTVYKAIGNVLVQKDSTVLTKELEEEKEKLSLRFTTFEKQETKLQDKRKELQDEIRKKIEGGKHE